METNAGGCPGTLAHNAERVYCEQWNSMNQCDFLPDPSRPALTKERKSRSSGCNAMVGSKQECV